MYLLCAKQVNLDGKLETILKKVKIGNMEDLDKYYRICDVLIRLDVQKGHLKWTISDVARIARVTRSLIYYYFGRKKEELLMEAARYMLKTIYAIDQPHDGLDVRIEKTLEATNRNPYLFIFWHLNRGQATELGQMIAQEERKLIDSLKIYFPESSELEIFKIYMLEVGAVALRMSAQEAKNLFTTSP